MKGNADVKINKNIMTITVDLNKELGPSSTGKSVLLACISEKLENNIKVGLNVYKPATNNN